jgi:CRISPR/Cas system-associated protein Cas7 (RAMP superfamily)
MLVDEGGLLSRDEGVLTAEDISGHQKGIRAAEDEVELAIKAVKGAAKEAKSALKSLKTGKRNKEASAAAEEKQPPKKVMEGVIVDDVDVDERMFLSPRHKKAGDVAYADISHRRTMILEPDRVDS